MSPFKNGAILLIVSALAFVPRSAIAQALQQPTIETNMDYVEAVTRSTTLAVNDLMAVFKMVLDSLPERVKVYPTENYFYSGSRPLACVTPATSASSKMTLSVRVMGIES